LFDFPKEPDMTPSPLIVTPEGRPRALQVAGIGITVLASGEHTGGCEFFHSAGPEGVGPGPHKHPWDESFYVIKGDLTVGIGDAQSVAGPGTLVHVPGGVMHWYKFGAGGVEMLSTTSHAGAAAMYTEFDREGSWDNPDRAKLVALAAKHGQVVAPTTD
jgi:quercetin dioxygenase-like cupin family protein